MMKPTPHARLGTRWEGEELLVLDRDQVVDRIPAREIVRVILVCDGGDAPADLGFAVVETASDHLVLPAESGIAGRVHFERQAFWAARPCVFWVDAACAPMPRHLLPGVWLLRRHRPAFVRLPLAELSGAIAAWPLEGPQTWQQRKWVRIAAARALPGKRTPK
jgi:hypothetical protein